MTVTFKWEIFLKVKRKVNYILHGDGTLGLSKGYCILGIGKVEDMELKDTIEGMTSKDYKERFIAEYKQLCIRLDKLSNTLNQYYNKTLSFTLACPIPLLEIQADDMVRYKMTLEERAEIEGINLD